ncbi:hypothetical protein QQS21_005003 [Conoideocrella luteorostrata]|uniref:Ankyrin repeat protein n=1 Tax=Conoideocrella luteorostrata TaxID=1105319 RepID=A0AAJ0FUY3_9HYPO|nr:hypothetical protein QQS21_005003 [Conoideocrella luteorostrata]
MSASDLPKLPASHADLARHITEHPGKPMVEIMKPYREYETRLREVYAQDRQNPLLNDPYINVIPLFTEETSKVTTRARDLSAESDEEKARYVMPLPADKRRAHGSPATVADFAEFQHNFNIFSESSLVEVDWSNVVAAGSSVVNCLLPVPKEFKVSKRKLREYYHEKFCPASDVDLFLYGLTHEQAIEKIKQIECAVKDALLNEVTVVRTKYAITIASQYPIVLRVYKSVSEILTGFDIDAAGGAYDGKQVYVTPRALGSFITQINHIDLSRRSPSYENRLSKYSHRNFEVYWPDLDRSKVDPTIFERSFQRTLGLARLLVLERLPTNHARETYLNKRRTERGRPTRARYFMPMRGNIKDSHEDEVADWLSEEDISNYHTFTVPYGERFNAKRIEKLCYTRDLLLNAEWNQPKDRQVYLHRHPAFFGRVEDVIEDCCGSCPQAVTPEEIEIAEKETEIYISGNVSFLIDDPGRQQIGSFNPLTEQDWTDMAYVGNTARLCQSIVDGDIDDVLNWLSQESADPNKRDYTGRTPLHLAVMTSTPDVVKCLVDHGARLTARLADGKTALHLAAARGDRDMVRILMEKSIENEEAEEERQARRRKATVGDKVDDAPETSQSPASQQVEGEEVEDQDTNIDGEFDGELVDDEQTNLDVHSLATGSFVNVSKDGENSEGLVPEESEDEPDYYKIDVLAWDTPCSPLHTAIVEGHEDTVKLLYDYGADSILPVKFLNNNNRSDTAVILTLTLALALPKDKAISMTRLLLKLGATSSQADAEGCTAFYRYVECGDTEIVDTLLEHDKMGMKTAINHIILAGYSWSMDAISPLHLAVQHGDPILVLRLLNTGALPEIDFDTWLKAAKFAPNMSRDLGDLERSKQAYKRSYESPLCTAIRFGNTEGAMELLKHGANVNALTHGRNDWRWRYMKGTSVLDLVREMIELLSKYKGEKPNLSKPNARPGLNTYLGQIEPGTYKHWVISQDVRAKKKSFADSTKAYEKSLEEAESRKGAAEKLAAVKELLAGFETLEQYMVSEGAKTFEELHPEVDSEKRKKEDVKEDKDEDEVEEYKYDFTFKIDDNMTESRRDGYIELMEAAWMGNLDRIKELTLQAWGADKEQAPLKMAITDDLGNSPFSIAFLHGRFDIARAILEIVKAQWSAPEKDEIRYRIKQERQGENSEEYSDEEEGGESDNEPQIESQIVDKDFTIDDIGQVSMQVKSHVKPVQHICDTVSAFTIKGGKASRSKWLSGTLFQHVLENDDAAGLKALLDMGQYFSEEKQDADEEGDSSRFTFPKEDFRWAVENGKTELLSLIIKRTGAGIPLDHLVKKSGVEVKPKPRYYQGLTVYGKKRKDWANAGRNVVSRTSGMKTPPLLHAALEGSIDGVEFFLSDKPHRLYTEFSKSRAARGDPRFKHLKESPGGFDRAISKWLGANNDLVIHCAVLGQSKESAELLEFLVTNCPEYLEKKTSDGETPLMIACRLGRTDFVKILVDAGADQSTRNLKGENIIHACLAELPKAVQLKSMLDLFDSDLRSHLFLQRKNITENGTTPLHTWIYQSSGLGPTGDAEPGYTRFYNQGRYINNTTYANEHDVVTTLQLLLEYSKGKELDLLNGAGETCLHTAVKQNMLSLVKVLVEFNPQQVYRENAVGRTPAELAHDGLISQIIRQPDRPQIDRNEQISQIVSKSTDSYKDEAVLQAKSDQLKTDITDLGLSGEYTAKDLALILPSMGIGEGKLAKNLPVNKLKSIIWDFMATAMLKHPGKRRLVSLNEANDVARRLGEKHTGSRYFSVESRKDEDDEVASYDGKKDEKSDFVTVKLVDRLDSAWPEPDQDDEVDDSGSDEE